MNYKQFQMEFENHSLAIVALKWSKRENVKTNQYSIVSTKKMLQLQEIENYKVNIFKTFRVTILYQSFSSVAK